jgi:hypothetical protein
LRISSAERLSPSTANPAMFLAVPLRPVFRPFNYGCCLLKLPERNRFRAAISYK